MGLSEKISRTNALNIIVLPSAIGMGTRGWAAGALAVHGGTGTSEWKAAHQAAIQGLGQPLLLSPHPRSRGPDVRSLGLVLLPSRLTFNPEKDSDEMPECC